MCFPAGLNCGRIPSLLEDIPLSGVHEATGLGRGRQGRGVETDFPQRCRWPGLVNSSRGGGSLANFPEPLQHILFWGRVKPKPAGRGERGRRRAGAGQEQRACVGCQATGPHRARAPSPGRGLTPRCPPALGLTPSPRQAPLGAGQEANSSGQVTESVRGLSLFPRAAAQVGTHPTSSQPQGPVSWSRGSAGEPNQWSGLRGPDVLSAGGTATPTADSMPFFPGSIALCLLQEGHWSWASGTPAAQGDLISRSFA